MNNIKDYGLIFNKNKKSERELIAETNLQVRKIGLSLPDIELRRLQITVIKYSDVEMKV